MTDMRPGLTEWNAWYRGEKTPRTIRAANIYEAMATARFLAPGFCRVAAAPLIRFGTRAACRLVM